MSIWSLITGTVAYLVFSAVFEARRQSANGRKVNWKKLFARLALEFPIVLIGWAAGTLLGQRFGFGKALFFVLMAMVFLLVAGWLARKHAIKSYARSIANYTAGGMNAPLKGKLHKLPDAVALCEKWRIRLPPLDSLPQAAGEAQTACFVCGKPAAGTDFYPFVSSPLVYWRLRRYDLFARRWLTGEERRRHEVDVSPLMWNGVLSRLGFCSKECRASFALWNFYIPVTRWQRFRWPFLVAACYLNRLFRRIFP